MSNSVRSLQTANVQTQQQQTVQPPPKPQTAPKAAAPQDSVKISSSAKQALANKAKPPASGDVDHDGESR